MAVGVHNIRMVLERDVILGGVLSEFLPPYMDRLKEYVDQGNPFAPKDCLHLSALRKASRMRGL